MSTVFCCPPPRKELKMANKNSKSEVKIKENQVTTQDDGYIVCSPGQVIATYEIECMIGEGAYGRVFRVKDLVTGKSAALKIIKNEKAKRRVAMTEIMALNYISSQDPDDESLCLKMLDWFKCDLYLWIAFPVMGLSVFHFLEENNFNPFCIDQVRHISYQLCHAVNFLHKHGMTHTDLKLENLLFVNSSYTTTYNYKKMSKVKRINCTDIRLIDFGLATRDEDHHRSVVSTRYYRAPEVILKLGWSQPCDVWSIGCILVEIYMGKVLFVTNDDLEHLAMMEKTLGKIPTVMAHLNKFFTNGILNFNWSEADEQLKQYCRPLKEIKISESDDDVQLFELIEKMLCYHPTKRIVLREALIHQFFNKIPPHQRRVNTRKSRSCRYKRQYLVN